MESAHILSLLQSLANPENVKGMARYGINPHNTYGISIPTLREIAKEAGKDHELAQALWSSGIHEARILATLIDHPQWVTEEQMEQWVVDFDSWDVCDQCCQNLFGRTSLARQKAIEWSSREKEFVKRAGFVLMTRICVNDKKAPDETFEGFFPMIKQEADDNRNLVKKAISWALRCIGKRNLSLNQKALSTAEEIRQTDSASARWIASDVIRELKSEAVQNRLHAQKEVQK